MTPGLAELHLHLEGSLRAATIRQINPNLTQDEIGSRYRFTTFSEFLASFVWACRQLQEPEHYAIALRALLAELDEQDVRYVEITLSAGVVLLRGQPLEEVWAALREASAHPRITVRWIPDAVRQFGADAAIPVAEFAIRHREEGIAGFGIGGDEAKGPARAFAEVYRELRKAGLHLTAHAGEMAGPESIWAALEIGAERIGHGIRAVEDPVLVRHLADRRIPLEVCPTSNVRTGAVASWGTHPLRQLFDAGVPVTLATDDPALFGTTLVNEYAVASERLGFGASELDEIRTNGWRYGFDRPSSSSRQIAPQ
jgi:adenosine deaminase